MAFLARVTTLSDAVNGGPRLRESGSPCQGLGVLAFASPLVSGELLTTLGTSWYVWRGSDPEQLGPGFVSTVALFE